MLRSLLLTLLLAPALLPKTATPKAKKSDTPGQKAPQGDDGISPPRPSHRRFRSPPFKVSCSTACRKPSRARGSRLAFDPTGRLLAGDQYGGLYRLTRPPIGTSTGTKIEPLAVRLPDLPAAPGAEPRATPKRAAATDGSASPAVGAHGLL